MATVKISSDNTALLSALSGTPADGDTVYIDRYATDFASADLSAYDLALVELSRGYRGRIASGAGGARLKLVCNRTSTGIFRNRSNSPRVELISTSSAGVIYNIVQSAEGGVLQVDTCDNEKMHALKGTLLAESGADVNKAYCYPGASLLLRAAAYTVGNLYALGGVCNVQRDLTNADIAGNSEVTFEHANVSPSGTTNLWSGKLKIIESGIVSQLNAYSGVIDLTDLRNPVTFSNRTATPAVTILLSRNTPTVTWSATADLDSGPVTVYVD